MVCHLLPFAKVGQNREHSHLHAQKKNTCNWVKGINNVFTLKGKSGADLT